MALDFLAGFLGGCAGVFVGHPFDTIKVQLQTQSSLRPTYRGTFHCMQSIIHKESVMGLYRGVTSPMCGVAVINAVVFGVYGNVQRRLSDANSLKAHFLAGASAGVAQSIVCSPIELAKIHLQVRSQANNTGPLRCLLEVMRCQGLRGVFRGLTATAVRDSTGVAVYFMSYEWMCRLATQEPGQQLSTPIILLLGGLAGTMSWITSFPVDVVKTRLQADGMDGMLYRYKGFWDCYRQSMRAEGYSFLSRGLISTILRAFPMNAATFAVVTWVFRLSGVDPHAQKSESSQPAELHSGGLLLSDVPLLLGASEPLYAALHSRQQQLCKLVGWPRTAPEKLTECFLVRTVVQNDDGVTSTTGDSTAVSFVSKYISALDNKQINTIEWDGDECDMDNNTSGNVAEIHKDVKKFVRTMREKETKTSDTGEILPLYKQECSQINKNNSIICG